MRLALVVYDDDGGYGDRGGDYYNDVVDSSD